MLDGSFDGANVYSYISTYIGTAGQFTVSKS